MDGQRLHLFVATALEAAVARRATDQYPITIIGISGVNLPSTVDANVVVLVGFGGGLDPALAIGDVVVDAPESVPLPAVCRRGKTACADRIVATPAQKAEFRQQTGADVVEMEFENVCKLTTRLGIPLVHIRSVSDTADHTLDAELLFIFDPQGHIKKAALASLILRRPSMIPELIRLGRHTKEAGNTLVPILREMLATLATTANFSNPVRSSA